MTTNTSISLNKLLAWEGNVRKTEADKGIEELSVSIVAHGLAAIPCGPQRQTRQIRRRRRRRRLLALKALSDDGKLPASELIPCHILDETADAIEISLA